MKPRFILVSLGLMALTILSFGLQAQEGPKATGEISKADKEKFLAEQQRLNRQFKDFQEILFKLKQNLSRGTDEERKRAATLDKILERCNKLAIDQEFAKMDLLLRTSKINTTDGVAELQAQSEEIAKRLRQIVKDFENDSPELLSAERKKLQDLIKKLQQNIDSQNQVKVITDRDKTDKGELKNLQDREANKTEELNKAIEAHLNQDKGKGGEKTQPKGETKPGGKEDGKKGESKGDGTDPKEKKTTEANRGETREGGKDTKEPKGETKPSNQQNKEGSPKENKGNKENSSNPESKPNQQSKEGSPQPNSKENKGGKTPEGNPKENTGGKENPKQNPKEGQQPKEGNAKDNGAKKDGKDDKKDSTPPGTAKPGDDKKDSSPSSQSKDGAKDSPDSQAKPAGKSGEGSPEAGAKGKKLPADVNGGSAKAGGDGGDAKGGQGQGETKTGEGGQAAAKDGGTTPKAGQPNPQQGAPQAAEKGPPPPPPSGDNTPKDKQNDEIAKSAKKIKEAGYDQHDASDNIAKDEKAKASKNQADAIKKMEEAKKKLERLLQQLREDELERVLAALQARCEKMLKMQIAVLEDTERLQKDVNKNPTKKPNPDNKKVGLRLSDDEKAIIEEMNKCIDIVQAEGSAVAFPEGFQQARQDMIHVQKRLEISDAGERTQIIEKDIIELLKDMVEAFKKQRDDLKDGGKPPEGKPGPQGQPGEPKLLELLHELKMVRSLQKRLNDRTKEWGRDVEQANDPQTIRELRNLSERQLRLQEIISRISKGDNK